jgi:hypothetical protein
MFAMKQIKKVILMLLVFPLFFSCYEDYIQDFDYSAVYFGTQKPLRTIVAYDEMKFDFGVAVGGLRSNNNENWAKFVIDANLLAAIDTVGLFKLLPAEYYTLSNNDTFTIPAGSLMGAVTLTLNADLFTADTLAHLKTYALPIRITETSLDSILVGDESNPALDYQIIVVKYMSKYAGSYYQRGVERKLDDSGNVVDEVIYRNKDLSKNLVKNTTTLAANTILTSGISNARAGGLKLTVKPDNSVELDYSGAAVEFKSGSGTYNSEKNEFYLNYSFIANSANYSVSDTLILRQAPEKDLRFQEW